MKILSLNIRGFDGGVKVRNLRYLLRKESIDLCGIQESLASGDSSQLLNFIWVYSNYGFCQKAVVGRSGGQVGS